MVETTSVSIRNLLLDCRAALRKADKLVLIDPAGGPGIVQVHLHEVEGAFDAAVAVVSLHHVEPLAAYLRSMMRARSDEQVASVTEGAAAAIERDGCFHVTKEQGLVRGRRP